MRELEEVPWRRAWQPTPVFLPGESYGHRSLVKGVGWGGGYRPWGYKESDTTEVTEHAYTCGRASKDQMQRFEIDQTLSNKETIWPKGFLGSLSNWDMKWR